MATKQVPYAQVVTNFLVDRNNVNISKEVIGEGFSSYVFKATIPKEDGKREDVAAKKVHRSVAKNEVEILKNLKHRNIISFYGTLPALEDLDTFIIMEIAQKGDLFNYLHTTDCKGPISCTLQWKWLLHAAWAIQYLHKKDLVHKDIKSPNFMIMGNDTLKLGDFGFTARIHESHSTHGNGTARWMAPELVTKQIRSKKSDVYSYGVVVSEIHTREVPFSGKEGLAVVKAIFDGERIAIPTSCPALMKAIFDSCLEEDHIKRTTIDGLLELIPADIIRSFSSGLDETSLEPPDCHGSLEAEGSRNDTQHSTVVPSVCKLDENSLASPRFTSSHGNRSSKDGNKHTKVFKQNLVDDNSSDAPTEPQRRQVFMSEVGSQPWCKCKKCTSMPTDVENRCCNNPDQCLSLHPKIDEILMEAQHHTTMSPRKSSNINKYYSELRGKAYRQVVAWQHGKKGHGNRIPLPSCVVWKIRKHFQDTNNSYTGFSPRCRAL